MRRVALYARVSTPEQDNGNQLLRLREFAAANRWTVVREYCDTASGANMKRPALDDMMNAARRHEFDAIVAVRLDRLARSVVNLSMMAEELDRLKISMAFVDQPIDTSTSMGRFTRTILSAVAEIERDLIRDRTVDGLEKAKKKGKKFGRRTVHLTEYQLEKARAIVAEEPDISDREMARRFTGISRNTLVRELRKAGILKAHVYDDDEEEEDE